MNFNGVILRPPAHQWWRCGRGLCGNRDACTRILFTCFFICGYYSLLQIKYSPVLLNSPYYLNQSSYQKTSVNVCHLVYTQHLFTGNIDNYCNISSSWTLLNIPQSTINIHIWEILCYLFLSIYILKVTYCRYIFETCYTLLICSESFTTI